MFDSRTAPAVLISILSLAAAQPAVAGDPVAGRVLFERSWAEWQGLGPFFNERSCVACHSLGGVGGAGPNSKNVELLSVEVPAGIQNARLRGSVSDSVSVAEANEVLKRLESSATKLHPGLKNGTAVLHTFGDDDRYRGFREALLGLAPVEPPKPSRGQTIRPTTAEPRHLPGPQPIKRIVHGGVNLLLSSRNSTAMFGAGMIDQITDTELQAIAAEQAIRYPNMAGRFLGRFGWRAQTKTLAQFVAGACTVELGLQPPPIDETPQSSRPLPNAPGTTDTTAVLSSSPPEISKEEFADLMAFIAAIPAPVRRPPADDAEANRIAKGAQLFESIGCAVCHRPSIGDVQGIYSDLLVHTMGVELADSQPAPMRTFRLEYYASENESLRAQVDAKRLSEWRTPPLWGLADSGPYLHDGRAPTIEAAILAHGGQAASSTVEFAKLSASERRNLMEFLSTLVAPETPERMRKLAAETAPPRAAKPEPVAADPRVRAERAAMGRLRLATAALERGDHGAARRWFAALADEFSDTAAAVEARKALESLDSRKREADTNDDDASKTKSD